jgi:hypothetical protein
MMKRPVQGGHSLRLKNGEVCLHCKKSLVFMEVTASTDQERIKKILVQGGRSLCWFRLEEKQLCKAFATSAVKKVKRRGLVQRV